MRDELERLLQAEEEEPEQVADALQFRATAYPVKREQTSGTENLTEEQTALLAGGKGELSEDRTAHLAKAEEKLRQSRADFLAGVAEELLEGRTDFLDGVEADVPEGWTALLTGMGTDIPEKWAVFLAGAEEKLPGMIRERFAGLNEESFRRENAGRFYETLSRTKRMARTAVQPAEKVRIPTVRQEVDQTRPGQDVRWLDRIFQRDARRYDGGFTWQ